MRVSIIVFQEHAKGAMLTHDLMIFEASTSNNMDQDYIKRTCLFLRFKNAFEKNRNFFYFFLCFKLIFFWCFQIILIR